MTGGVRGPSVCTWAEERQADPGPPSSTQRHLPGPTREGISPEPVGTPLSLLEKRLQAAGRARSAHPGPSVSRCLGEDGDGSQGLPGPCGAPRSVLTGHEGQTGLHVRFPPLCARCQPCGRQRWGITGTLRGLAGVLGMGRIAPPRWQAPLWLCPGSEGNHPHWGGGGHCGEGGVCPELALLPHGGL